MSWTHSSKIIGIAVLLAVALGAAGTVAAISFSDVTIPEEAEEGSEESWSVTMEDPFDQGDLPDTWTLQATTELDDADITITPRDVGGDPIEPVSVEDDTAEIELSRGSDQSDVAEVEIEITGTVPDISEFDYDDKDVENFVALELSRIEDGDRITLADGEARWSVHRYTEDSKEAREAIDAAQQAVDDADSEDARNRLDEAKVHYNNGEFQSAIGAANDAKDTAESEGQTMRLILMGGGALIGVAIIAGGVYYWREQQQDTSKLQ